MKTLSNKIISKLGIKTLKRLPPDWFKLTAFEQTCFKKGIISEEQSQEIHYKFGGPIRLLADII